MKLITVDVNDEWSTYLPWGWRPYPEQQQYSWHTGSHTYSFDQRLVDQTHETAANENAGYQAINTAEQYGDNATSRMDKKRTLTITWQWINWDSPLCCGIHFVHPDIDYSITVILFRFLSYHSTVHRSFTTEICRNNHCHHHLHLNLHPHPFHPTRKPTTSQNGKKRLPPSCPPLEFDSEPAFMSSNPLHG